MSGAIGRISSTIQGLYDSLLDASFRGVTFSIIDSRHEVGRRVQRFLFPGRDDTAFQDLGAHDGAIRITGLISGDSYIANAQALHTAFRAAGPATLVHPWLGEIVVVLESPATISFTHTEFRIARFEASFVPFQPFVAPPVDTLQGLLDALDAGRVAARAFLRRLLAPLILPLALVNYANRTAWQIAGWWKVATRGGLAANVLGLRADPAIDTLAAPISVPAGSTWADTMGANLAAVPEAIASASVPTPQAAVGPGASAVTPAAADPAATAFVLLGVATQVAGLASDPAPGPGLAAAVQAQIVLAAIAAASDILFTSQQEAMAWRDRLLVALDRAIALAAAQAAVVAIEGATLWRSLVAVRAAVAADYNALIGRLPPVLPLVLPAAVPVWLIAQFRAGDRPDVLAAVYRDLVVRNRIAHPGLPVGGSIEVLG